MDREPVPSAIVAQLLEAAKDLETWAVEHRQASLAEHERGVLRIFRRVMGPVLGEVLERQGRYDEAFTAFVTGNRLRRDHLRAEGLVRHPRYSAGCTSK